MSRGSVEEMASNVRATWLFPIRAFIAYGRGSGAVGLSLSGLPHQKKDIYSAYPHFDLKNPC